MKAVKKSYLSMVLMLVCQVAVFGLPITSYNFNEGGTSVSTADNAVIGDVTDNLTFNSATYTSVTNPKWNTDTTPGNGPYSLEWNGFYQSGSYQKLYANDSTDLSVGTSGAMTLEAWVKIKASGTHYIFNKWNTNSTDRSYFLTVTATGAVQFSLDALNDGAQAKNLTTNAGDVTVGQWTYIVARLTDVAGLGRRMQVYVNGSYKMGLAPGDTFTVNNSANQLWIGAGSSTSANAFIDGLNIYNYGLTDSEIAANYLAGTVPEPATMTILALGGLVLIRRKK